MKKIAILGSTGSIGTQTLEVVRSNPDLKVVAIAAGSSVEKMEEQIREFRPIIAGMWTEEAAKDLRDRVTDLNVKIVSGMNGLLEIAVLEESQVLVTAIVGMIGIRPTIAAIRAGKNIALANKETLVTAGHIIMPLAKECGVSILPVDSEHSAIFQSLNGEPITVYGDGAQTRSFMYVDDLVDAMFRVMRTPDDFTGPVNIGNPCETSVLTLARKIVSMTGSRSEIILRDLPLDDPQRRRPDISLAIRTLGGWQPIVPLEVGLQKTIEYMKLNL